MVWCRLAAEEAEAGLVADDVLLRGGGSWRRSGCISGSENGSGVSISW